EGPAQRLLNHAVDSAAREHGTAFDVDGAHRVAEEHYREDEPRCGSADRLLGNAAGVKGRRGQIVEYNGRGAPERDEREHHGGCHNEPDAVRGWGYGRSCTGHASVGRRGCRRTKSQEAKTSAALG